MLKPYNQKHRRMIKIQEIDKNPLCCIKFTNPVVCPTHSCISLVKQQGGVGLHVSSSKWVGGAPLAKYHLQNLHPSHITEPIATRTYTYTTTMLMSFRLGRAPYLESAFIILNLVQLIVSVLGLLGPKMTIHP